MKHSLQGPATTYAMLPVSLLQLRIYPPHAVLQLRQLICLLLLRSRQRLFCSGHSCLRLSQLPLPLLLLALPLLLLLLRILQLLRQALRAATYSRGRWSKQHSVTTLLASPMLV